MNLGALNGANAPTPTVQIMPKLLQVATVLHRGQASQELHYSLNHSTRREANYNLEPTRVWIQQVMGQQRLESTIRLRFKSSHFAQLRSQHDRLNSRVRAVTDDRYSKNIKRGKATCRSKIVRGSEFQSFFNSELRTPNSQLQTVLLPHG